MTPFLPDDYTVPVVSNYMKFVDGDNNFRILSSPVIGWGYWDKVVTNKPVRLKYTRENYEIASAEAFKNPENDDKKINHFWAMVVVDYSDNQIKILEVTQKSLQKSLLSLVEMRGWGNPVNKYDILVKKEGYKKTTEYFLSPIPPSPLDPAIEEKWKNTEINLEALFYGANPFDKAWIAPVDPDNVF